MTDWKAEAERWRLNCRRMALLAEAYAYKDHITEGGLMRQVHRVMTDQDVEPLDDVKEAVAGGDEPVTKGESNVPD